LAGLCDVYDEHGAERTGPRELAPLCRRNVRGLASRFAGLKDEASNKAEEFRTDDSDSFAEYQCIAKTWEAASDLVWDLLGGRLAVEGNGSFPDELVERLKHAYMFHELGGDTVGHGIRAVLAELATVRLDVISASDLSDVIYSPSAGELIGMKSRRVLKLIDDRLAPVITAKDARNDFLLGQLDAAKRDTKYSLEMVATAEKQRDAAQARIAELESRTPANEVQNVERTQYEQTIALQNKRIKELEVSTRRAWTERDYFQARANEDPTKALVLRLEPERDEARKLVKELQEQSASPAATSSRTTSPRIYLGVTFERELADGTREVVDPSTLRIVVDGEQLVPVALDSKS
jgi:hypothetical protein